MVKLRDKPYLKLYICLKIQFFTCGLTNTKYMCQSSTMLYRCHGGVCLRKVYIFAITVEWLDLAPKRKIFFRQYNGIFTMWCRKYKQIWPFLTEIAPKIVKKKHESRARFLWFVFTDNETHFHGKPDQRLRQTFPLISDVKHTHDQPIYHQQTGGGKKRHLFWAIHRGNENECYNSANPAISGNLSGL